MAFLDETGLAELWSCIGNKYGTDLKYWWEKHDYTPPTYTTSAGTYTYIGFGKKDSVTLQYSSSLAVSHDGTVTLVDPITVDAVTLYDGRSSSTYQGKYWIGFAGGNDATSLYNNPGIVYIPSISGMYYYGSYNVCYLYSNTAGYSICTGVPGIIADAFEYVHSANSSAYPNGDAVGNYYYVKLGIPLENAASALRIESGSYTGTGTSGSANPNTLTFSFAPKIVFLFADGYGSGAHESRPSAWNGRGAFYVLLKGATRLNNYGYGSGCLYYTLSANSVSWYSTAKDEEYESYGYAKSQLNSSGASYRYLAIG